MKAIFQGWNLLRILRAALGIAIIIQGVAAKETMTIALGAIFGGMAFLNIGCCGANGCAINNSSTSKTQRPGYEELDSKK